MYDARQLDLCAARAAQLVERQQRTAAKLDATAAAQKAQSMRLRDMTQQLVSSFGDPLCVLQACEWMFSLAAKITIYFLIAVPLAPCAGQDPANVTSDMTMQPGSPHECRFDMDIGVVGEGAGSSSRASKPQNQSYPGSCVPSTLGF